MWPAKGEWSGASVFMGSERADAVDEVRGDIFRRVRELLSSQKPVDIIDAAGIALARNPSTSLGHKRLVYAQQKALATALIELDLIASLQL